ncbi:MAG: esterase/lipase family protein [Pyrinomonadaceae bacterium]
MSKKSNCLRSPLITHHLSLITLVIALAMMSAGCGARRTPDLERIFAPARARTDKAPVIVIPGILGSQLMNRRTREVVWPSAFRSSVDGLSLPTTEDLAANRDELVAERIVVTAKLARLAPDIYVYYELLNALRHYGNYRDGDWNNPPPDGDRDTFYVFPYDWRRDNVETAQLFVRRVEELKRKLGRPDLRFNIVAHSMGGLVARYAAMYGDEDLPAEGVAPQPTWAGGRHINKIFMFGTPNEGTMESFATLLDGYSINEGLRRRVRLLNKLSREDAVTIPSIFQLLPHREAARFLDQNLAPLALDLYDPATWRTYGWSPINNAEFRARYERGRVRDENGQPHHATLVELDAYFAAVLKRAKSFHAALDAHGTDAAPVSLYTFGGDCEETLNAPVIRRDEKRGRWVTLTEPRELRDTTGRKRKRSEVIRAMYEPGDGRVTRRSLLGERLDAPRRSQFFNTPLPIVYGVFACDLHSELQNNKTLQDNALTVLINEVMN